MYSSHTWKAMAMAAALVLQTYSSMEVVESSSHHHPDHKITRLPGQPHVGFQQFSGYITVDDHNHKALFYYFAEADINPASKPLVLWLNGGPGCSSLGVGAFSENGPFRPDGEVLVRNEYSWNRARDNLVFLQRWLNKFPQYRHMDLFLAGESYAGHYIPQLAKLIVEINRKEKFNLKGIALGNPVLEFATDLNSQAEFLWSHGLISDSTYNMFTSVCNYSRYVSEYYRRSVSPVCSRVVSQVTKETSQFVDKYDVTLDVCISSVLSQSKFISPNQMTERIDVCVEDKTVIYLNRKDVQKALHARLVGVRRWDVCSSILEYQMLNLEIPTISLVGSLVKQGIQVLVYSGDQDSVIPLTGSRRLVSRLARELGLNTTVPYRVWFEGKQVGGWTQVYGNILSFATIRGASHEAPFSQPERSLRLFKSFLEGRPLPEKNPNIPKINIMPKEQSQEPALTNPLQLQDKELDPGSDEPEAPLPLTVTSRALYMLGDIAAGQAYRITQWMELVRKRSAKYHSSGFPHYLPRFDSMPSSVGDFVDDWEGSLPCEQTTEVNLWERLGKAAALDIESCYFSWDRLSSLHHTEHSSSNDNSEDEMNKALEVTVNSGGVVFFGLFNQPGNDDASTKEAAAVIKISSSRMATQSERLGYEFAKWLGVRTPQARVIHNCSLEWLQMKEAAEKARDAASSEGDECGEMTCSELLEALELSRCLLLISYVQGSPLLESPTVFESRETAEKTAAALGRILMLDLVIRNEDRLPCHKLRWRGNSANLLLADKMALGNMDRLEEAFDSAIKRYKPRVIRGLHKDRRATSVDSKLGTHNAVTVTQTSDLSDIIESPRSIQSELSDHSVFSDFPVVAIDSGVPRRPPAGKRANDQEIYPRLVELLLNSSEYSSNVLHEITLGKLGRSPIQETDASDIPAYEMASVVKKFRSGFRAALRDLQGFHIFLLTLHQRLENLLRIFFNIIDRISSGESDKEDLAVPESPSHAAGSFHCASALSKERLVNENNPDFSDSESQRTALRSSSSGNKEGYDCSSPMSRDSWHGRFSKGSAEPLSSLRLTAKLRDFHKYAKVDAESNKELEQWNEMLKSDVIKLCQENNFNSGFFEGSDNNGVVDAYELKVRLEHILERIALISEAANTERPSRVTSSMFIGGALAARSVFTLQRLGITHVLCLCSNEIGQADSQFPDLFEYKNFAICDNDDTNISTIFDEAVSFTDRVEQERGKVLVHCFEGKSRSATLVLAYLMLRKNCTLLEAWNSLKQVHRRAQPNDGFAKILVDLDKKLHGRVSMEWQQRKPTMKVCPICGVNAGLSSSSLKLHLQKSHKKLSSGSVDSAMTMEIQKALTVLKISRGGSVIPKQRSHSDVEN
ncbi:hypothetical protein ACFX14_038528 [Malus domestica]